MPAAGAGRRADGRRQPRSAEYQHGPGREALRGDHFKLSSPLKYEVVTLFKSKDISR